MANLPKKQGGGSIFPKSVEHHIDGKKERKEKRADKKEKRIEKRADKKFERFKKRLGKRVERHTKKRSHGPAYPDLSKSPELEQKQKGGGISKVEPQVITGFGTGPNYTAGNTPWYQEGGDITKREKRAGKAYAKGKDKKGNRILDKNTKGMDKFKKGGSQNGPTGFGY